MRKVHVDVDVHEMRSERGFEDSDHHASREMVSRVMKDLEERGVIETLENGSVVIKERLTHD